MTSVVERTVGRGKENKGGKILAMSILWVCVGLVAVSAVAQFVITRTNPEAAYAYDRDVVATTSATLDSDLQPIATKIVASDNATMIMSQKADKPSDLADVWRKLETLAPANASDAERLGVIEAFLMGLDYKMVERGGQIISVTTGNTISAATLTCYLNGYIPDKPYIKTNCPAF